MCEHWHGTLGQIKLEMDLFFLAGINHVFYHGSCYSPKDAPWPGWFFYASTKADWRNWIWHDMPLLNDYIARCQSVLQAGEPANDVLVYWPIHDLWMDSEGLLQNLTVHRKSWIDDHHIGDIANLLDSKGYAFDFVSDRMLEARSGFPTEPEDSYWYFVANHTASHFNGRLELAVPFTSAILHDPMTGDSCLLPTRGEGRKRRVYIDIAAGESFIIQTAQSQLEARPYAPIKTAGRAFVLEGRWSVEFIEGGPALPEAYSTDALVCWTNAPDERAKAFAGTARYGLTFDLPHYAGADDYVLDLGDVRESARVRINGENAADLFALPMRARVGRYLKKGANTIEIEVTNLSANRIRDLEVRKVNWKIMHDANIVTPAYRPFDGSKWPVQPSGLLGPVELTPVKSLDLTRRSP